VGRAAPHSTELCGGTHVGSLGMIGPITVVSESSIGANTRRIEAVTGAGALSLLEDRQRTVEEAGRLLRVGPDGVLEALQRLLDRQRQTDKELQRMKGARLQDDAATLAGDGGTLVVARRDGLSPEQLRDLAQAVRRQGPTVVVVAGSPDGAKASVAVATDGSVHAGDTVRELAALVGGGGGGSPELAVAGGRDPAGIDAVLAEARRRLAG
jgi:alanyl-tRNA synthetase